VEMFGWDETLGDFAILDIRRMGGSTLGCSL
jgi:hypothetical protein